MNPATEAGGLPPLHEALRPCVVQVSGGEPLVRDDVVEIVRSIKGGATPPMPSWFHWSNMTQEKVPGPARGGYRPVLREPGFPTAARRFRGYPACTATWRT